MQATETSTKQRYLIAALELFSTRGFEAVSLSDIANAVGLTRPALYKHFRSKQELFDAMGDLEEARRQKTWMLSAAVVFGLMMTLIGGVVSFLTPVVFGDLSTGARTICRDLVLPVSVYMPLWVYINVQFSVARAGGDTVMGAVVDGVWTAGAVIPGILLLARFTTFGPVLMYGVIRLTDFPKIITAHL